MLMLEIRDIQNIAEHDSYNNTTYNKGTLLPFSYQENTFQPNGKGAQNNN